MCKRHSFILTRAGKVLDGLGLTDSHTEIRELHGLHHTNDSVNAYEWQPPPGWPETDWSEGLTKDTEVFVPKSSHLAAMERHLQTLYPTRAAWDVGDTPRALTEAERLAAQELLSDSAYITVPEVTLPNGYVVPAFRVAQYPMARGTNAIPISTAAGKPWHSISYREACAVTERAGLGLLRETQWLAIAWDIANQGINWTGGEVGKGDLVQGVRDGKLRGAQTGDYESKDPTERTWHQLSNGERIYHFAGNIFQWVFDDVQGDKTGVVARPFSNDSVSLTAPHPSLQKGTGWRPEANADWSGDALLRGGCWRSGAVAGAFYLSSVWPDRRDDYVGFRCTQPGL